MGKIIYLPLEHIENRYTVHMDEDILKYLDNSGKEIPAPFTKTSIFLCF